MWAIIRVLLGGVIGCAVLAFFSAIILEMSAKMVTGDVLGPDRNYVTAFLSAMAMFLITAVLGIPYSSELSAETKAAWLLAKQDPAYRYSTRNPAPTGLDAILGWGSTAPVHVKVQSAAAVLSVLAWVGILWLRHKVTLWRGLLIVLVSQLLWAGVLAVLWLTYAGIAAVYRLIVA